MSKYFNSQPHKEADPVLTQAVCHSGISTHSLTRRLTWAVRLWLQPFWYFNSQPHKEADNYVVYENKANKTFQLTASQGGWPPLHAISIISFAFQLTASQGGWRFLLQPILHPVQFQLTASQGGWPSGKCHLYDHFYFNSQPHKEADVCTCVNDISVYVFQLTASQGGWLEAYRETNRKNNFNSQPHKEADSNFIQ